jgi:integrase/recombinase XerD
MQLIDLFVSEYIRHLNGQGRSRLTLKNVRSALRKFSIYLSEVGIARVDEIDRRLIEDYQQTLGYSVGKTGRPLSLRTRAQLLGVLKGFTRYLQTRNCFISDPGKGLRLPKKPKRLPRIILTSEEVRRILDTPDTNTDSGYRDRVILELLYDTAIRRAEVGSILMPHLDLEGGYFHITGKGNRQRVVPVSKRVCGMVETSIRQVRPRMLKGQDCGYLILNRFGRRMDPNGIWAVAKRHASRSGVKKNVSTHTFRHTCATHMMNNGAPVRHIQELLGHESLESTQIYTRVTINDLKEAHRKYHPGNR